VLANPVCQKSVPPEPPGCELEGTRDKRQDLKIALFAITYRNALNQRHDRRGGGDAGNVPLDGQHVVNGERVVDGTGNALSATFVFGVHEVRANRLDLIQHILFAGEPDRRHQDQRRRADHHSERGKSEPDLIAQESVIGETEDLAQCKMGATVAGGGCGHLVS